MPTKKLTELFVERVKRPASGRVEYFDAAFGGLALRVSKHGHKSWSLHYRMNGRLRRLTLGNYPAIVPAAARREAQRALDRVRAGADPADEKKARREKFEADTFGTVAEDYLTRHLLKNNAHSTYVEAKRDLEKDALPRWRDRPIASISRREVLDLIDRIAGRGAEIQANRTLARLRALFNWAITKDRLTESPVSRIKPPTKERTRDRVLTDAELRWMWIACEEIGWPFGPLTKLLALTGQRRDEVASMEWNELNFERRAWTMPGQKTKNNRGHEIQLSDAALNVLNSIPQLAKELIFTTTGQTAVSGFSRAKERLDAAMVAAKREELGAKCDPVPPWRLHDLRRTAATGMARLNFPPHVVDKVLNHLSGTIRGVAAVYNRFEYIEERRAALEAWGKLVQSLVTPAPANVIALRG
jgi:integrase